MNLNYDPRLLPTFRPLTDRNGGPTLSCFERAEPKQLRGVCAAIITTIDESIPKMVAQQWINNKNGELSRRLSTLRYRPAQFFCGKYDEEDWNLFGEISLILGGEGLINGMTELTEPWDGIGSASHHKYPVDIILTSNPELVRNLGEPTNFIGLWFQKPYDQKKIFSHTREPERWYKISPDNDTGSNSDLEWLIRRIIHNMRSGLMYESGEY